MFINQMLKSLKEKLNNEGRMIKTTPEGLNEEVECTFEEPASLELK